MQACDRCHARKTRCDRRIPQCSACERAGAECLHVDRLRQRNLPRAYLDGLEKLVQGLRDENETLRRKLAVATSPSCSQDPTEPPGHSAPARTDEQNNSYAVQNEEIHIVYTFSESTGQHDQDERQEATSREPRQQAQEGEYQPAEGISAENHDDMFSLEVGYLSLVAATGESRFLGASSGLGIASIINTIVETPPVGSAALSVSVDEWELLDKEESGLRTDGCTPSDPSFPPLAVAMRCIERYFTHTHLTFPLLHKPTFMETVERIYNEPGYYKTHAPEAFYFDMVLTIGSASAKGFKESASNSATYYDMARAKAKAALAQGGLDTLKCILFISQHGIFSNVRNASANIWHLLGIGVRICFELGLHLEPKHMGRYSKHRTEIVTFEEEMAKRCFWCLYNLDRVVSFTLGRPVAIRDEEVGVSLPSPLDDSSFGPGRPIAREMNVSHITPFLHLIRIRRIAGQILGRFWNSREGLNASIEEKIEVRRKFRENLTRWNEDTQHVISKGTTLSGRDYGTCYLSAEWYEVMFNKAMLLLYRPSPYMTQLSGGALPGESESDLSILLRAARGSILAYSTLHQNRRLNYSWITLHGVFVAGLAYVYSVGRILHQEPLHGAESSAAPDILEIIEDTRTCSKVLVAISGRWDGPCRSSELFDRLSSAVIRDALKPRARSVAQGGPQFVQRPTSSHTNPSTYQRREAEQVTEFLSSAEQETYSTPRVQEGLTWQVNDNFVADEFRQFYSSMEDQTEDPLEFPSEFLSGFTEGWPMDQSLDNFL
ncbi:unnamed protein product [Clonostachys rosea]|uniref:Zn(2)-C6 fungal-type domain-containing protein n=1 Tax=Bionectria ochroleuca TaxID=29856 RepID=A0ABY6V068_BIOOC|nr:unnamed protein product [Clonostachys rosea]